ncbi:Chaperone protein DnaJ (plasmid) [Euzebya pacifica]|uniref:Chaperone protein DnaJ n=1 Tax=Euzebya pacifica TaxID=1608957 RepID=A0A346Y775_9ACTN|nr:DnaJ domain-containing protein [Euzebya pacifica]AXV10322.1 Chaperone protein DnaJ [Euzebya pacifica]
MDVDVNGEKTAYDVLGLDRNASAEDIRSAYRRLAATHHPDAGGNEETFKAVTQAHTLLKDPRARAQYDAELDFTDALDEAELGDLLLHGDAPSWEQSDLGASDPFWFLSADHGPGDLRSWSAPSVEGSPAGQRFPMAAVAVAAALLIVVLLAVGYVITG